MQDQPTAAELIEAVSDFIRNHAMPQLQGHAAFHARVAANALDIVKRELQIAPEANTAEQARLRALLARDGTLDELNRELCARIERGEITLATAGLADHLWDVTLAKLAIDQPNYSGYRRALEERRKPA
jgi:hypothetical protein